MAGSSLVFVPTDSYVARGILPPFQHTLAGHLAVPLWEVALGICLPRADNMAARVDGAAPYGVLWDSLLNSRVLGDNPL